MRSLPGSPEIVGSLDTPGNANDVRVVGNRVYLADGAAGLQIIDVADPTDPQLLGAVDTPGTALDLVVSGTRAYLADGAQGLQIIDVGNPAAPGILGTVDTSGTVRGVGVAGNLAVVAESAPTSAVRVIDVTDPAAPAILGSVFIPGAARDLAVRGDKAYVAASTGGLRVVDFGDPANPLIVGNVTSGFIGRGVEVSGDFAFVVDSLFPNAVPIVDITDPAGPIFRATLDFSPLGVYGGTGLALSPEFVYLTAEFSAVTADYGSTGDTRLFIGQYVAREDTAGIPPVAEIVSPTAGAVVIENSMLPVVVAATDDLAVAGVDFTVDGAFAFTDTTEPYEFTLTVPEGVAALVVGATATDFGGNVGVALDVTLSVIADPGTTAVGLVVALEDPATGVAGAAVTCSELLDTSDPNGLFSIAGVPTAQGFIECAASFDAGGGATSTGTSDKVPPVPGGITDVGTIVLGEGELLSISRDDTLLRTVDPADGSTLASVPIILAGSAISGGTGLATDPVTGTLWALLKIPGQLGRQLVTIDPVTGIATSIGDTGTKFAGLAFDAAGTLYGVTGDGAFLFEKLFIFDQTDASSTVFLSVPTGLAGEAIAFNPDDGLMYHTSGNFFPIFESIDLDLLTRTGIPLGPELEGEGLALTYWKSDGAFLWADNNFSPQELFRVTSAGVATFIAELDHISKGLAFR